jgi:hypothetical protein
MGGMGIMRGFVFAVDNRGWAPDASYRKSTRTNEKERASVGWAGATVVVEDFTDCFVRHYRRDLSAIYVPCAVSRATSMR